MENQTSSYKILVTGSRSFVDKDIVYAVLETNRVSISMPIILVHGGCDVGVDEIADSWANFSNVKKEIYKADWDRYGKGAGPIRNKLMVEKSKPDVAIAFWDGKSTGTRNCIEECLNHGVNIHVIIRREETE